MPKSEIDYSNTIIYKITCKDLAIMDVYVGHTTNFVQRKHAHKQSCINLKSTNYNCKLYEVIRSNGGWNNWKMEIINFFECKDHYEARKKEQEYFISLNATLNSIEPMPKPKVIESVIENKDKEIFFCASCNIYFNSANILEEHNKTNKHIKKSNNLQISDIKYKCDPCNTITSNKKAYNKHLLTQKHIKKFEEQEVIQSFQKHECINCNKIYESRSGLWRHIKTCNSLKEEINKKIEPKEDIKYLTTLVMELSKNNAKLTKQMSEVYNILINKNSTITV